MRRMAKASPDLDEEKRRKNWEENPLARYLAIGNMDQIKHQGWWKKPEMYKNTYFVLPSAADGNVMIRKSIFEGESPVDIGDFIKFWQELADQHKERRLMVDYLCAVRGIEEMGELEGGDVNILREMVSKFTWIYRLLLIKGQDWYDQKKFQEIVSILIKATLIGEADDVDALFAYFAKPHVDAVTAFNNKKMEGDCETLENISYQITRDYLRSVMIGLVNLYADWTSFDMENVVKYEKNRCKPDMFSDLRVTIAKSSLFIVPTEADRKDFMGKVKASVPHWNKIDRAKILGIIEKSGNGPKDFMTRLLEEFGMEQFKVLALGKEYFCANCKRSSYIGEERLWGCPRCEWEGTYPKARYCNENCQKADWIKHKMEFHSVATCNTCKKKADPNKHLRRCGRCIKENIPKPAYYCDEICQKQDWRMHKEAKHTRKEE